MRCAYWCFVALLGCGAASVGQAASLTAQSGTVYLNVGAGYVPVQGLTDAPANAKVMVSPGGSALVTYSDRCAVRIPSGVWSVQAAPPCEEGVALLDFTRRMNQEAPPTEEGGISTTTLVVGGLVVGGAVAAAVVLSQDDDDRPSSP